MHTGGIEPARNYTHYIVDNVHNMPLILCVITNTN